MAVDRLHDEQDDAALGGAERHQRAQERHAGGARSLPIQRIQRGQGGPPSVRSVASGASASEPGAVADALDVRLVVDVDAAGDGDAA